LYQAEYLGKIIYSYHPDIADIINRRREFKWELFLKDSKDNIVVDVGAHIGLFTLLYASYAEKIYSFEPHPENYKCLKMNTADCNNVIPIEKAISTSNGTAKLYLDIHGSGGHSLRRIGNTVSIIEVETIKWDTFLKKYNIEEVEVLKLHVEGLEAEILEDMKYLPNKIIVPYWHGYTGTVENIERLLIEKGYKIIDRDVENVYGIKN